MNATSGEETFPVLLPVYNRLPVTFVRGEGVWLWDAEGRRYLDFGSGIAVCALGHCHPRLVEVLREQAGRLWHVSNLYRIAELERLAARLVELTFADTVFLCNSGAEAVEAAIKIARRHHFAKGRPRPRIVTFEGAFHGRTMATISAAGGERLTRGFEPLLPGFDRVPFADLEAVERAIGPETGAVLIEPVQGEGGVRPCPPEFLRGLRELCDRHGLLLVLDEVQCGMGRTGHLLACEGYGVRPDIVALAKGLGGGFPVGAVLATKEAAAGMTPGTHGSTFGGNPLASAVALAAVEILSQPGFLDNVRARGAELRAGLDELKRRHPGELLEVRGIGLMLGIRTRTPNTEVAARLRAYGLLTVPAGDNVLRLLPPLVIGPEHVDLALDILDRVLGELPA